MITGVKIKEHDDTQARSKITGLPIKNFIDKDKEGLEFNNLTGQYVEKSEHSDKLRWPSLVGAEPVEKGNSEFELFVPFLVEKASKDKDQRIVYGIVYEPGVEDSQGDSATAEEIEKAAHQFMVEVQTFKVMHKGKTANVKVLESYIAPQDLTIAGTKISKGTWVLVTKVFDDKVWKAIKDGELTGYSMAGYAKAG